MAKSIYSELGSQKELILRSIGKKSDQLGLSAYLVGGAVRDLKLGFDCDDLDFVIEGDAYTLVDELYCYWQDQEGGLAVAGKPIKFKKYGTAKLGLRVAGLNDVYDLDFASARREIYPTSGAQPVVTFSNITDDLARRDFSINALAIQLNDSIYGKVIDNFKGIEHLNKKLITFLHSKSFEDDPARIIRAIRYIERLNFVFEEETWIAFEQAVCEKYLARLPRFRLFDEFRKLLSEKCWASMIKRMAEYGVITQISPYFCDYSDEMLQGEFSNWAERLRVLYRNVDYAHSSEELLSFGLSPRRVSEILKK